MRLDFNKLNQSEDTDGFEFAKNASGQVLYQSMKSETDGVTNNEPDANQKIDQASDNKVVEIQSDIQKEEM